MKIEFSSTIFIINNRSSFSFASFFPRPPATRLLIDCDNTQYFHVAMEEWTTATHISINHSGTIKLHKWFVGSFLCLLIMDGKLIFLLDALGDCWRMFNILTFKDIFWLRKHVRISFFIYQAQSLLNFSNRYSTFHRARFLLRIYFFNRHDSPPYRPLERTLFFLRFLLRAFLFHFDWFTWKAILPSPTRYYGNRAP